MEVTTTLRDLKVICDWYVEEDEDLDREVVITWHGDGFIGMYYRDDPDGGYINHLKINFHQWTGEDLRMMQDANALSHEIYSF